MINQPHIVNFNAYPEPRRPASVRISPVRRAASAFPLKRSPGRILIHPQRQRLIHNDWANLQPELLSEAASVKEPHSVRHDLFNAIQRKRLKPTTVIHHKQEELYD